MQVNIAIMTAINKITTEIVEYSGTDCDNEKLGVVKHGTKFTIPKFESYLLS